MPPTNLLNPLELARAFGLTQADVAMRLRITPNGVKYLASRPRHARRIRVAVLEAILEQEKLALTVESLLVTPALPPAGDADSRGVP
jgi:transcriptional regulator with XRE-family HTH domain